MADRRRIVTMSPGGRPILDLDLELTSTYQAIQDTFAYAPGQPNSMTSREPGRYGGDQIVGEENDNGTVSWQALVRGTTPDQVAQNIEALLRSGARTSRSRLLEWRPDGVTYSSYFRIAGPIAWKPTYSWKQFAGAQSMLVEVTAPVRPLVLWDPMRIVDPFDVDSRADYTFDAGTAADVNVNVSAGVLTPVVGAALTAERGARHAARGYDLLEGQATVKGTPVTTITGYKLGARLRASAANTYVEVYVDDNGTNSRLRIDTVIAGTRLNKATTNLVARLTSGNPAWVRARIEGNVVTAEYFSSFPTQGAAPTLTNGYTLVVGDAPLHNTPGKPGWSWVPAAFGALLEDFEFRPFTRASVSTPAKLSFADAIPGTAPALADITIIEPAGVPTWALLAWSAQRGAQLGVYDTSAAVLTGWVETVDANGLGGSIAKATTTAAAAAFSATWQSLSLNDLQPDDFTDGRCELEVWARVSLAATLSNPRLACSVQPIQGIGYGEQFTMPYGSVGKTLVKPSSGTVRRFVRLGTLSVPADKLDAFPGRLKVAGSVDAGGSGEFGLDHIYVVPANRRAVAPTGVPNDANYPDFMVAGAKTARSDLSGAMQGTLASDQPFDTHGLDGSLITVNPGFTDLHVKLSDLVPDDPTPLATSEITTIAAGVAMDITPRSYMLRA